MSDFTPSVLCLMCIVVSDHFLFSRSQYFFGLSLHSFPFSLLIIWKLRFNVNSYYFLILMIANFYSSIIIFEFEKQSSNSSSFNCSSTRSNIPSRVIFLCPILTSNSKIFVEINHIQTIGFVFFHNRMPLLFQKIVIQQIYFFLKLLNHFC